MLRVTAGVWPALSLIVLGCTHASHTRSSEPNAPARVAMPGPSEPEPAADDVPQAIVQASAQVEPPLPTGGEQTEPEEEAQREKDAEADSPPPPPPPLPPPDDEPPPPPPPPEEGAADAVLSLEEVVDSVRRTYPLIRSALAGRQVADGLQLAAWGAFDTKSKAESISQPVGFYENYRHLVGLEQPLWSGADVFAGYRIGRGEFEPWYRERVTDEAGEFKAGVLVPLLQDHRIDERRAAVLQAEWERRAAEPEIQLQLLDATLTGSVHYWAWVGAGRNVAISEELLDLARERQEALEKRVDRGDLERIALLDNRRLILSREAKLIAARQKLQQAAIKLSLFLRAPNGAPVVPPVDLLPPRFPTPQPPPAEQVEQDVAFALANRPEPMLLDIQRRQLDVERAQARNLYRPQLDAALTASDDVGENASPKGDKAPTVLEAGLFFELPLQRRKARGKLRSVEGKIAQVVAKRQLAADKIVTDVHSVYAALLAAFEQIERAREAVQLARQLEEAERRRFELGESDLLLVNLREQQAADAALAEVQALLEYFDAEAAYRAALGRERP